ncbi:DNA-directed RNA polymerase I subunit RPA1 [Aricia agestis]|uniref:DNA-directed RNA polymerase I subunit RPA1 n=1 Tax=Aricia agestis TaxID=91739 RepID=UPI001C204727|nr:DNA-directed RNA polymerase I subunit RPA1 [Aricia agestis]XP_041979544.1 DNA-directed RNA polymerase I subunit RPA1 [Aricia agestis]
MEFQSGLKSSLTGKTSVDPESVQFLMFTDEDVRKLSVAKITNSISFDSMGNPTVGGLYDPALGPTRERDDFCVTCSNSLLHCPGHFGHIELPLPVVNPLFIKNIYTLFRVTCLKCHKIQMDDKMKFIFKLQLDLIDAGHVTAALDLESFIGDVKDYKSETSPDKPNKVIRKCQKLLKKRDGVLETFQNKNVDKLRSKIINNYFRAINVAKTCIYCRSKLIKVTTSDNKIMYNMNAESKEQAKEGGKGIKILMPDDIRRTCHTIEKNDGDILCNVMPVLKHATSKPATDTFFMQVVPVPPPSVRPCNVLQGELVEHPQSHIYKAILSLAYKARIVLQVLASSNHQKTVDSLDVANRQAYDSIMGKSTPEKMHSIWQELQKSIIQLLSSEGGGVNSPGLKQILEKKTGVIRMHMMGKRVNFAARSVITPDPNVDIDEIGIPDVFATKLTYPVPVTEWNVEELRKMVINGPNVHPGAEKLETENGRVIRIPPDSLQKRKSLAKKLLTPDEFKSSGLKTVHRHLINGDVLILNRQPSLHKPSMMAHRARILKGEKTLRLHYANCKSYNADFDGDEMNAHFPQNEIARSEAYNIMSVTKQYLVPKDGTPLSGLIQDHVISGVRMSIRGKFFTKADYQQLVFQALANHKGNIKLLPPTILKPVMLWSGKQVLSTIIINIVPKGKPCLTLIGKAKISSKAWETGDSRPWKAGGTPFTSPETMSEAEVVIRNGELLCGVLDKTHYGATPYGLVHCMYELYGGDSSSALLSSFSKVFTFHLQWIGFTLGVKDILVVEEADEKRNDIINLVRNIGKVAAVKATDLPADVDEVKLKEKIGEMLTKDPKFRANLDRQYKNMLDSYTNNINTVCLKEGLLEKFPANNLQLMVQSGAKGSTVNTMQISCLLGQIELEGKRPPLMISGRSLPSFTPYDITPRAGGFIDGRFLTGIQPQEFFFHCMAGREGLIDTAVKTSRSGYLQRCLIKHLEGLSVAYDYTVRDADSSVIQYAYGEDGLDVLKCQFLKKSQFKFLDINSKAVVDKSILKQLNEEDNSKAILKSQKAIKKWKKKYGDDVFKKVRHNGFAKFSAVARNNIDLDEKPTDETRDPYYWELEKMWRSLDEEERQQYDNKICPDPITSKTSPEYKFGMITERLDGLIESYLKSRGESNEYTRKEKFKEIMSAKYLESMAAPGEPVGLLAAQSIGEPSTQMTLNTFHFAGRGDMNVTLGIPRLREILMTASAKLKTPNMDIPFYQNLPDLNKKAEKLRRKMNRVTVSDVLEKIDVSCEIVVHPHRELKTTMRFSFLPHSQYKAQYIVKPAQIIKHMQKKFFNEMFTTIRKQAKTTSGVLWSTEKKERKRKGDGDDDEEEDNVKENVKTAEADVDIDSSDEEGPNDDEDNTDVKIRNKRAEEQEYEDPESEEEEKSDDEDQIDEPKDDDVVEMNDDDITMEESKIMANVVESVSNATNYSYDTKKNLWCELTVLFPITFLKVDLSQALRSAAMRSVIYEIKNIRRAITNKEKDVLYLKTEGINIVQMFKYKDCLDLNKLYSNDIHAIANTYGIEAANKVIIKEIQNVFNVYGIEVDPRHLSLVADYMTYNGVFEPMSRKGMEASTSPLQQMSFESSLIFLKEAVLNSKKDCLRSASSCLMLGQPCRSGTGAFSLQHCRA